MAQPDGCAFLFVWIFMARWIWDSSQQVAQNDKVIVLRKQASIFRENNDNTTFVGVRFFSLWLQNDTPLSFSDKNDT